MAEHPAPQRVLYVEDSPADRLLTRRHLSRHAPEFELTEAASIAEALARLADQSFDVVLSDYRLPDGTGLDVLAAITARNLATPVLLITGSGDVEAAVQLLKAGAADYIVKRLDYLTTLPRVLHAAIDWHRSARELRATSIRVLYVESKAADVAFTREVFRDHGPHLSVDVVATAREALDRLRSAPYEVCLLNHRLPDASGTEVLKSLRAQGIQLPVVVVTDEEDEDAAVQAFKLGAVDYVVKRPGYVAKLPSTLENVLVRQRLADEREALVVLNSLAQNITSLQVRADVVDRIARGARDLLRADWSVLWLRAGDALEVAAWSGLEDAVAHALGVPVPEVTLERWRTERRVALPDSTAALLGGRATGSSASPSTLAASLVTSQGVTGLIAVASPRPREFTPMEERLLIMLADYASVALENTRLYQAVNDQLAEIRRTQGHLVQSEKLAALGRLAAGIGHELKNPLMVITGRLDLFRLELSHAGVPMPETLDRHLGSIGEAAERMTRIMHSLSAYARPARQPAAVLDLRELLASVRELLAHQAREAHVTVAIDVPAAMAVRGDRSQMMQILLNLATNAIEAMAAGGGRLEFRARPEPNAPGGAGSCEDALVAIEVADTGPGIPPDQIEAIWEPFHTTKAEGSGLGLTIVQALVAGQAGASITVRSHRGEGTTFRLIMPAAGGMPTARDRRA